MAYNTSRLLESAWTVSKTACLHSKLRDTIDVDMRTNYLRLNLFHMIYIFYIHGTQNNKDSVKNTHDIASTYYIAIECVLAFYEFKITKTV